jgi:hypothetical protein
MLVRQHLGDLGRQGGESLLQCLQPCSPLGLLADIGPEFGDEPFQVGQLLGGLGQLEDYLREGTVGHQSSPPHGDPAGYL